MKYILNEVIDGQNQSYRLYVDIDKSSLKDHYDIRFFSKFSGANDPESEQTKWKTTLPTESIFVLTNVLKEVLDNG